MHEAAQGLPPDGAVAARPGVPAINRAVAVMDLVARSSVHLGVSEIARHLGLPKSSVHGICETLAGHGLLRSGAGGYRPGPKAAIWAAAFLSRTSIVEEFHHQLAAEPSLAHYTVTLSMLDGGNVVYLACRNSDRPLGFTFHPGMSLPAVYTATGKAILSALPQAERSRLLSGKWPAPFTPNSVADAARFEEDVERWQRLGYALDNGEIRPGMICLGVAIRDASGRAHAGLAVSMTGEEARPQTREALGGIIARVAERLSLHRI